MIMKKALFLGLFLLMAGTFSFSVSAQTKPSKSVEVTGTAVPKSRGENPNIKVDLPRLIILFQDLPNQEATFVP